MKKNKSISDESFYSIDHNGKRKLEYIPIVKMLKEKYYVIAFNRNVYVYSDGLYVRGEAIIEAEISEISMIAEIKVSITAPNKEILHYLKTISPELEYPFNTCSNALPVNNGVIIFDFENGTFKLVPHDPKYKFNYKIAVDYVDVDDDVERIIHNESICKYVKSISVPTLYQLVSQSLLQALGSAPFKKAYIAHGDPDAGKSSFLEIILRLFGPKLHSHVSLQRLAEDRFALAELEGKMFNVYDDLANVPMKDAGVFKNTTGSTRQGIQRKGQNGYDANIFAVQIYTCNSPPEVGKRVQQDTAFWERWEYLLFENHFANDPYFYDRIFTPENLSVLFYDILKFTLDVRENGLPTKSTAGETRELWNYNSDPMYKFLEINLDETENTVYVDKEKLLETYIRWCISNDVESSKMINNLTPFTRALDKYQIISTQVTTSNGRFRCYSMQRKWKLGCGFSCDCLIPSRSQSTL